MLRQLVKQSAISLPFVHVPRSGRYYHLQEGTTLRETLDEDAARNRINRPFEIEQFEVQSVPVDELRMQPDIVKIDVQGAELHVLRGLARTIERAHPVFMIENGPVIPAVEEYLAPFGYSRRGYDGKALSVTECDTLNVFFVPDAGAARAWCEGVDHGK